MKRRLFAAIALATLPAASLPAHDPASVATRLRYPGPDAFIGLEGGGPWFFQRGADSTLVALASGIGQNRRVFTRR